MDHIPIDTQERCILRNALSEYKLKLQSRISEARVTSSHIDEEEYAELGRTVGLIEQLRGR